MGMLFPPPLPPPPFFPCANVSAATASPTNKIRFSIELPGPSAAPRTPIEHAIHLRGEYRPGLGLLLGVEHRVKFAVCFCFHVGALRHQICELRHHLIDVFGALALNNRRGDRVAALS